MVSIKHFECFCRSSNLFVLTKMVFLVYLVKYSPVKGKQRVRVPKTPKLPEWLDNERYSRQFQKLLALWVQIPLRVQMRLQFNWKNISLRTKRCQGSNPCRRSNRDKIEDRTQMFGFADRTLHRQDSYHSWKFTVSIRVLLIFSQAQ